MLKGKTSSQLITALREKFGGYAFIKLHTIQFLLDAKAEKEDELKIVAKRNEELEFQVKTLNEINGILEGKLKKYRKSKLKKLNNNLCPENQNTNTTELSANGESMK